MMYNIIYGDDKMSNLTKFSRSMLGGKMLNMNKKTKETSYEYHWHDYYEIILYLNCKGQCIVNDRPYEIDGNCIFLVTPKDFHEIKTETLDNAVSINISFSEQIVDNSILPSVTPTYVKNVNAQIIKDFERLYKCFCNDEKFKSNYIRNLFNCILIDILSCGTPINENVFFINPLIQKAITIVTTTPEKRHNVQSLASELGVNADYFSHLFKKETDITFTSYLTKMRIEHAKRLLENTDSSVIDISYDVGFNTPAHFHKTFKALTGFAPNEYRKKKRQLTLPL